MAGIGPGEDDDHFEAYERERGAVAQACDEIDELRAQVEANRARYESARRERDEARAEVEALRGVIACRTCTGWGFLGYPDQPEPCPTCGDLREAVVEAAGGY